MKTQVCIVGAGPAGLLLGHLLRAEGIECVVLERQAPDYVLGRIRAGVLEQITVSLMARLGLDARLKAEGLLHGGFNLADGERLIRIDVAELTGKHVGVYGQTELTRDLMEARDERGLEVIYEAADVALHGIESDAPFVTFTRDVPRRRQTQALSLLSRMHSQFIPELPPHKKNSARLLAVVAGLGVIILPEALHASHTIFNDSCRGSRGL